MIWISYYFLWMFLYFVTKGISWLYWNKYWFLFFVYCEKIYFSFQNVDPKNWKEKNYFGDRPYFLSCPWTNILNWLRLIPPERRVIYYLICPKYFSYHDKIFHTNISALQNYKNRENLVKSCRVKISAIREKKSENNLMDIYIYIYIYKRWWCKFYCKLCCK